VLRNKRNRERKLKFIVVSMRFFICSMLVEGFMFCDGELWANCEKFSFI
jgi:hypothetical protein